MQTIPYNQNYLWFSQDDYVTQSWEYLEWFNIDWISTWYWAVLWPTSNKTILTNNPVTSMQLYQYYNDIRYTWLIADWEIYKLNSADNTPEFTFSTDDTQYDKVRVMSSRLPNYTHFIFIGESSTSPWYWGIHRIWITDYRDWNWDNIEYDKKTLISSSYTPFLLTYKNILYVWMWSKIITTTDWDTFTDFTLFRWWNVIWITTHWTRLYVYSRQSNWIWKIYVWDWVSDSVDMVQNLPFNPARVVQYWDIDYLIDENWLAYIWSWLSFQKISKTRKTNRWYDNSWLVDLLNFKVGDIDWVPLNISLWDWYLAANWDTKVWIYKYGTLIPWTKKTIHKVLCNNSVWDWLDHIYTMDSLDWKLYYSYQSWTTYWVDYIDFISDNKQKYWYIVYPIERIPNKIHKEQQIRITTSNTAWNNYIKLYKRLDNWTLELIRTINDPDNWIYRHKITTENNKFIDKQLIVELYNDDWWANWPILHWLEHDFKIIED